MQPIVALVLAFVSYWHAYDLQEINVRMDRLQDNLQKADNQHADLVHRLEGDLDELIGLVAIVEGPGPTDSTAKAAKAVATLSSQVDSMWLERDTIYTEELAGNYDRLRRNAHRFEELTVRRLYP